MKRTVLYSTARAEPVRPIAEETQVRPPPWRRRWPLPAVRRSLAGIALLALAVLAGGAIQRHLSSASPLPTQADIDRAVLRTLEKESLPSQVAKASALIGPSIVRVVGLGHPEPTMTPATPGRAGKAKPESEAGAADLAIGTGVVITETGAILTNLHVVSGARQLRVSFADGSESPAFLAGVDPANDLAVLRAARVPDDLQPATLVSTAGLRPGDMVAAVGFPFGFGPSVSSGVVSGLKREFRSADGERMLSNLIQFDAAANPGNSGGPLVNMKGEVVGIVTALLNPVQQRFFVGLGFAVPIENAAAAVGMSPF
ncbi:MAG: peptidase S1 [Candidatus Dactylopiibacterium carminicum]|uniref:Peptidase S1 n=1 Tax=Candidatus Dactylopiibacterium carminicum TaxID=857335 RepID=A0A272EWH4_9RHOO|nr:trypsin-like peptidase domain-containing protein [Candidatus Dactylopiibacterium carminicum]KAF7599564.1 peptidase S1 [Candidatus Dactylopiibacterium carminicum]PAS94406.1 MAG: peptidase S1 [Candidatus Dactylopiibacterium carminicum]PAS96431.1 MAG: peptidase S1 [Candidatus Dactylopiibacterium carminicum]PAS99567.1 MAG: hypothetical protein BSR46_07320 [Candidatus Dactylopiibacterium carminicum]